MYGASKQHNQRIYSACSIRDSSTALSIFDKLTCEKKVTERAKKTLDKLKWVNISLSDN